jgi:hypothetical protein
VNVQVNDVESRLRDAYRAAGDTIAPESIRGLDELVARGAPGRAGHGRARHGHGGPRRLMHGRLLVPLAAAAAVVAVAVALPAVLSGVKPTQHRRREAYRPPGYCHSSPMLLYLPPRGAPRRSSSR